MPSSGINQGYSTVLNLHVLCPFKFKCHTAEEVKTPRGENTGELFEVPPRSILPVHVLVLPSRKYKFSNQAAVGTGTWIDSSPWVSGHPVPGTVPTAVGTLRGSKHLGTELTGQSWKPRLAVGMPNPHIIRVASPKKVRTLYNSQKVWYLNLVQLYLGIDTKHQL